jgi:hypothetical protein
VFTPVSQQTLQILNLLRLQAWRADFVETID